MRPITPLQPNIIRYLVEQNKWTELTNHIMDLQSRVGLLEVIVADQEWRPIETAPKDGTTILVFHNGSMWTVLWSDVQEWHDANDYGYTPTHWMPLPKPPTR